MSNNINKCIDVIQYKRFIRIVRIRNHSRYSNRMFSKNRYKIKIGTQKGDKIKTKFTLSTIMIEKRPKL
jgi:hypothetical protein